MARPLDTILVRAMRGFWALFWGVLVFFGMVFFLNWCEMYGWIRLPIIGGAVLGVVYTIYNYEEIACTCDDPDHEH